MPREKKFVRYALNVKLPSLGNEWRILDRDETYNKLSNVLSMLDTQFNHNGDDWLRRNVYDRKAAGMIGEDNWKEGLGKYMVKRVFNRIFPFTDNFKKLNDAFLAEYDSREDLQELWSEHWKERYFLYDQYGTNYDAAASTKHGYDKRPSCFSMYLNVINGTEAGQKIELARPTPYQEGDLVLLRKASVGRRYVDPLFAWRASPDSSVDRIGTVMLVTEKTPHWRGGKGSKIISVLWFGKDEAVNVEERHLKWHERPTLKNGLKTRE